MLILRLLLMVLTIICLMEGHAEVSSSTTGIRNGTESPVVKPNEPEIQILDRKKKKKPKKPKKPSKKKKPKPKKPKPAKPVTTTPTMTTSTLKTTTILTTPTMETTATTTDSPTTTATTFKTTTSTTSTTTSVTKTTSTSTATTTEATSSTASITTATTTIPTTTTTTTAATTADSGAGGECKATNGKSCIFPFKDGKEEYNECKNHGGTYFWCATAVYDSGKYKHWSYCPKDGPCPLEGDEECRTTNNKPCVFPFKDGGKEYNECADHGGQYFWCATGTNSAGKYTAWSKCPKDGSCPLPQKGTTPVMTSTATTAVTTPPTNDTSATASAIANVENALTEINDTLQNLETAGFSEDEKQLLETMNDLSDYLESGSLTRNWNFYDAVKINSMTQQLQSTTANIKASKEVHPGFISAYQTTDATCSMAVQNAKLYQANAGPGRMFQLHTISKILGIVTNIPSSSACCAECKIKSADSELFEHSNYYKECYCFKTKLGVTPESTSSMTIDSGVCSDEESTCDKTRSDDWTLNCPDGYAPADDATPSLSTLKDWTIENYSPEECVKDCNTNYDCKALIFTLPCRKCKLLTDNEHTTGGTQTEEKKYCLQSDNTCGLTRGLLRNLKCGKGYKEITGENLYPLGKILNKNVEECAQTCTEQIKDGCIAVLKNEGCDDCQLLSKRSSWIPATWKPTPVNKYCLREICKTENGDKCIFPFYYGLMTTKQYDKCVYDAPKKKHYCKIGHFQYGICVTDGSCKLERCTNNKKVDLEFGCSCGEFHCQKGHTCIDNGSCFDLADCKADATNPIKDRGCLCGSSFCEVGNFCNKDKKTEDWECTPSDCPSDVNDFVKYFINKDRRMHGTKNWLYYEVQLAVVSRLIRIQGDGEKRGTDDNKFLTAPDPTKKAQLVEPVKDLPWKDLAKTDHHIIARSKITKLLKELHSNVYVNTQDVYDKTQKVQEELSHLINGITKNLDEHVINYKDKTWRKKIDDHLSSYKTSLCVSKKIPELIQLFAEALHHMIHWTPNNIFLGPIQSLRDGDPGEDFDKPIQQTLAARRKILYKEYGYSYSYDTSKWESIIEILANIDNSPFYGPIWTTNHQPKHPWSVANPSQLTICYPDQLMGQTMNFEKCLKTLGAKPERIILDVTTGNLYCQDSTTKRYVRNTDKKNTFCR